MPLPIAPYAPTIFVRKDAFDRLSLNREMIDQRFGLTADEFRVEGDLIAIGPLANDDVLPELVEYLEQAGAIYFDDFFELSGNWPEWLRLFAMASAS